MNAPGASDALFDSGAAVGRENNHRSARRVINHEGEKKLPVDVDLLFNQHGFDWKLSDFHRQHARGVATNIGRFFGEGHATNTGAPSGPGLNLDNDFGGFLVRQSDGLVPRRARGEFLRYRDSFISSRNGTTAWDLESVGGENGFALIFVKSCHG